MDEGAARRLRQDGQARRGAGALARPRDWRASSTWTGATGRRPPTSRSTSRLATPLRSNFTRYVERRLPVVIGTTGWARRRRGLAGPRGRGGARRRGVRQFLTRREPVPADGGRGGPPDASGTASTAHGFTRRITPPSATRPSGTALLLRDAMTGAGYDRAIDISSTRAGAIPGHAYGRFRQPLGYDRADAHGARPPRLRHRGAGGREVADRAPRVVHDAGRLEDGLK